MSSSETNSAEIVAAPADKAAAPGSSSPAVNTHEENTTRPGTTPSTTLEIEEVVIEPKAGYFITKKAALITGGVIVVVFVAVILITYFGKSTPKCDNCQSLVCSNPTQTQLWLQQCPSPVTTRPPSAGSTRTNSPTQPRTTTTAAPPRINYRLPTNLSPTLYELTIKPYFKPETVPENFDGSLTLHFDCKTQTNRLVLNMRFIEIINSSMVITSPTDAQYGELKGFRYTYNPVTHFMTAELSKPFRAGQKYILKLDYKGLTQFDETGFYRSYYTDANGNRRWLITSQMQYIEARKAFPCFDEPAFKAVFRLTIIHDKSVVARSNNYVISSESNGQSGGYDWQITKFADTPVMSSYLIAILISDFECLRGYAIPSDNRNITVDVCARPTGKNDLGLALESAVKTSEFFERYYGIEYPLNKLDHVGVPQFKYGAMENWGLAVYFESNFLYNDMTSSQTTEMNVVRVIAHEVSHMWFGNWVTPKWWNDLWLNEGFARYMEHAGANYVRPAWRMFDRLFNLLTDIIQQDATDETREVSADVETPDEINDNINPTITYGKGGSIVKMLNYILSSATFQKGLTRYFGKFGYQNVDQFDLWRTLDEQAKLEGKLNGVNLSETMRTWTYQKGHPVLHVKLVANNRLELEQSRFVLDSNYPANQLKDTKWHIPFSYSIESNSGSKTPVSSLTVTDSNLYDKITWVKNDKQTLTLSTSVAEGDFLLANLDMAGFYRVNYDEKNWNTIINQLNTDHLKLSARARTQLISDSFSLSQAGYLDAKVPLNLINFMSKEFDYLPWNTFVNNRIGFYNNMLQSTEFFGKYKEYIRGLITPYYTKLGWIEDKVNDLWVDRSVRNAIVDMACRMDQSDCVNTGRNYFKQWMSNSNSNSIPAGPRVTAYCTAVRYGSETEFNFLYDQLIAADKSGASRTEILVGLACSKDEWALDKLLNERMRLNKDVVITIRNVINRSSFTVAWNFIKTNWDHLYSNSTTTDLRNILNDLSNKLNTQAQHDDLVNFFENKQVDDKLKKELNIIVKKVKANVNWFSKNRNSLSEWFQSTDNGGGLINYRLPTNLIPSNYDLTIKAYVGTNETYGDKAFTYEGYMKMTFRCAEPTDRVIFHSVGHDIDAKNLSISSTSDSLSVIQNVEYDLLREFAIVRLSKQCKVNSVYVLGVSYKAKLNDNLYGFYKSSYVNAQGKRVYLATTDFQPSKARYAFPCFDEPALKAKFRLTTKRDQRFFPQSALFNTPLSNNHIEYDENGNVWSVDTFKETVALSTYLVCFVISDFKRVEGKTGKGKDVQVYARPQAIDAGDGEFGLSEAVAVLDFFADYFNIPYPLDKSTQIAIPDFNPGAMENWGLITYREASLLYNPQRDTILEKRRVAVVVSHELAHQWFGNLVTPKWWNDLWLNEGFASFVEYLGLNHTQPEWRDLDFFFVQKLSTMFKDSLESSHAISVEVNEPGETSSLFDKISYDKGSSIIRMMSAFLTEQTFKKGVSNYLKRYEYSNAEQDNLWEELTKQAHADSTIDKSVTVKQIMDTWTLRKGYPVVHINRNYGQNEMTLKQSWFLVNPLNKVSPAEYNQYRWWVPLTFTNQKELNFDIESQVTWLRPEQNEQIVKLASNVDSSTWVVANLQHSGFFRVNYDEANWNLLINQLNTNYAPIHPINRATLIDDSFNLGRAELIDQLKFFELVKYAKNENDSLPFTPVIYAFNSLTPLVATDYDTYLLMQNFVKGILANTYNRLGWKDDLTDPNDVNLQISSNQLMCKFGKQECIDSAKKIYYDWFNNNIAINANFKSTVFSTAMRYGTEAEWRQLYDKAIQSADYSERLRMLRGLASTQNYELLKFLTTKTSDPDVVKSQDEVSLLQTIADNNIGSKLVYDYLEEEWDYFFGKYGGVSFTLPNLVEAATSRLSSRSDLKRVENFVLDHPDLGVAEAAFQNAIETININIRWLETNLASVNTWLQTNQ